jgi:hypothetical protein
MPAAEVAAPSEDRAAPRRAPLLVASFLMLFVELALIRGTAANVVYLTFFTNFILLASFLGIGIGFLRTRSRDLFVWMPVLLIAAVLYVVVFPATIGFTDGQPRFAGLGGGWALPAEVSLPVIFLLTTAVMACVGQLVGRLFSAFAPLDAYRLDILGSIAGIAVFSALSFLHAGPIVWGAVVVVACAYLLGRRMPRWTLASLAVLGVLLALVSAAPRDIWSPYYRVTVAAPDAAGQVAIRVNGRPHQTMVPVEDLLTVRPFYGALYGHLHAADGLGDVAIIGAGSGNDVALALSKGAAHVDAVEIDPVIQHLGAELHPSHPYDDPRVTVHIDDGRAFLEQTDATYDLVMFALPDSLTLVSGAGALRLESYLFTTESMEAVRDRLAPDGVFAMYNFYRPDVFDRYGATLTAVFGHPPCIDLGEPGAGTRRQGALTIGLEPDSVTCTTLWQPSATTPEPSTDDHPFPYLAGRSIPDYYVVALVAILLASLVLVRAAGGPLGGMRNYVDLFFMGAAFLLLETKNVVQFALLFGTTWFVNSLVFAAILLSVYVAVEIARRVRLPRRGILYVLLAASLAVAFWVQPDQLLSLAAPARFASAAALSFTPVLLANLIFAQRFKDVGSSTVAFAANLLGAMVGGLLEYGAIVVGYRSLLILVALLYGLAFVTGRRHLGSVAATGAPAPGAAGESLESAAPVG